MKAFLCSFNTSAPGNGTSSEQWKISILTFGQLFFELSKRPFTLCDYVDMCVAQVLIVLCNEKFDIFTALLFNVVAFNVVLKEDGLKSALFVNSLSMFVRFLCSNVAVPSRAAC